MLMNGVDVVTVAAYLGNSPDVIFRHYGHAMDRGKREALRWTELITGEEPDAEHPV